MGGRLHDGEGGMAGEAETPGVGVYFYGKSGGPRLGVERVKRYEKAPVVGTFVLDGARVWRALA